MTCREILLGVCLLGGVFLHSPLRAETGQTPHTECWVLDATAMTECGLRTLSGNGIKKVLARVGGRDKKVGALRQLPDDPKVDSRKVAVLFVIDTSKSMSSEGFKAARKQMQAWLAQARPRHVLGIARFDKDLEVLAKIGSSKAALDKAVGSLSRDGQNTEFYKSIERGIKALANFSQSSRRFLVLLSDGASEDAAWNEGDVVTKARKGKVAIFAIGYKGIGRAGNKASLQHLEKLALQTGGAYTEADSVKGFSIASPFSDSFFSLTDNGGWVEIDTRDESGRLDLELIVTDSENLTTTSEVSLNFVGETPLMRRIATDWSAGGTTRWLLIGKGLGLLALGLLPLLGLVWKLTRSPAIEDAPTTAFVEEEDDTATLTVEAEAEERPSVVYAYIDLLEGDGPPRREEVNTSAYRIGRAPTNDLVLEHPTVSNDHAVVTITADNLFEVRDVHSSNGTFVNGEKVGRAIVQNGDHISIGMVNLKLITQV